MTASRRLTSLPLMLIALLALLALAGGLFAIVQSAQAQRINLLVENTAKPINSAGIALNAGFPKHAQQFTTGPNPTGYTLSFRPSVSFFFIADPSTAGSELTVTLNQESGGSPGTALCTLDDPSQFNGNGGLHLFGTNRCPTLAARTTYFLVIERANANTSVIELTTTDTHGEDPGAAAGWSIGDGAHHYVSANTPPWTHSSSSENLIVRLEGDVNNNPGDVCDRTWWVQNKIVQLTPANDTCATVAENELAAITELDFNGNGSAHLKEGDFDGLTGLVTLDLSDIGIGNVNYDNGGTGRLKAGLFDDLSSLEVLNLSYNNFYPRIDDDAFDGLGNLTEIDLRGFSRNPAGTNSNAELDCWSNVDKARRRAQFPWNARLGSPLAFEPLTSLVTYNYDADFDTRVSGYDYSPRAYATNNYKQPPAAPTGLSTSVSDDNEVTITWSAPSGVSGITGYLIERDINNVGPGKNSCPKTTNSATTFHYVEWHDSVANRLTQTSGTGTTYTDDIGGTGLLHNGRQIRSLTYHVFTIADGARSMPATINAGGLRRGGL